MHSPYSRVTRDSFQECSPDGIEIGSVILEIIVPLGERSLEGRLARLPPEPYEVKANAFQRNHTDETGAVEALGPLWSEACRIFGLLRLDRPLVLSALKELSTSRVDQVTL